MANRYWVGGTASWDGTAGTKWSETSGGPGGASVPTTADDVFFDANSTGTVTISTGNFGAKSINCTGFTGTITGTAAITVAGSVTLVSGMTYSHTGTMTFSGTGTLITAGKLFSGVNINGVGITVTLGDSLNISNRLLTVSRGEFNTNNYSVSAQILQIQTTDSKSIILGSSLVNLSGLLPIRFTTSTNFTFDAGTSTIGMSYNSDVTFEGGGQTFYNVSFSSRTFITVTGSNTFNNLSVTARDSAGTGRLSFDSNQTINGTLTISPGTDVSMRRWVRSTKVGTPVTLTCNAVSAFSYVDFSDITFAGNCVSGGPITGTRLGNAKGNTNIVFDEGRTVYYRGTGTSSWATLTNWSLTSGGTGTESAFPLPQDSVVFPATYPASGSIVTIPAPYTVTTLNMSLRTSSTMTLEISTVTILGDWINGSGTTISGSGNIEFQGRQAQTFTTQNKSFGTRFLKVQTPGGSLTLNGTLTIDVIDVENGTFNTANYNITANRIWSSYSSARALNFGSSTISLSNGVSGQGAINFTDFTNLTVNGGTSQINLTNSAAQIYSSNQTFYNVSFTSTAVGTRTIEGSQNTFNNLSFTASAIGLNQLVLTGDQTINGTFNCQGSSPINRAFVRSSDTGIGTTITISAAVLSANNCDFRDIAITGGAAGTAPLRAGDCGGNLGIAFPTAKTVYRVGTNTSWTGSASWATSSGGSGSDFNYPLPQDTAIIDNNTTGSTISFATVIYNIGTLNCENRTTNFTLDFGFPNTWYGSLILGSGITTTGTSSQTFSSRNLITFTTVGKTISFPIDILAPNSIFRLGDAITSSNSIRLYKGTFDANNYNLTATRFSNTGSTLAGTMGIIMGSGLWTLTTSGTASGNAPWSVQANNTTFDKGTANILLSNDTTTDKAFFGGGFSYNKLTIGGSASTSTLFINNSNNSFTELASTKTVAHTICLAANQGTIGIWSITGTAGNQVTVNSSVPGTRRTFRLTNTTDAIDYLSVEDIGELNGGRFFVGSNSIDGGNNNNVYFINTPELSNTSNMLMMLY